MLLQTNTCRNLNTHSQSAGHVLMFYCSAKHSAGALESGFSVHLTVTVFSNILVSAASSKILSTKNIYLRIIKNIKNTLSEETNSSIHTFFFSVSLLHFKSLCIVFLVRFFSPQIMNPLGLYAIEIHPGLFSSELKKENIRLFILK